VVAVALVLQACGGTPLSPWHTEKLEEEFVTSNFDQAPTFDEYLRLEERVFQELEASVISKVDTGPSYDLVRYSHGSSANPLSYPTNWNRTFELEANVPVGGVLLLHGMSDSPYSLRALAKALHDQGYWVVGMRMPGHGTAPSGLKFVQWEDMAAAVRLGAAHLAHTTGDRPIHVVGYSAGGALALNYALDALEGDASPVPASLVLISPAIGVHPAAALAGLKSGLAALPGLGDLAWLQIVPEFDPYKYNSFATNAGAIVHFATRSVAQRVRERSKADPSDVLPPILVLKSTVDATVSNSAVIDRLLGRLAPNRHELVIFDINRFAVKSKLMVSDPGAFTDQVMADETLPFAVTFITNENPKSTKVVARMKPPFSAEAPDAAPLNLAWPDGVLSLSHVALPIPPDDPLYGQRPPDNDDVLFLGQMAFQGERGLLQFPADWLLRLRHNPFYDYLELRAIAWIDDATRQTHLQRP